MQVAKLRASRRGNTKRFAVRPQQPATLGRSSSCTVRLLDPSVSRSHCKLAFENGKIVVSDLESSHGLVYRGQNLKTFTIEVGDGFHVGETFVKFDEVGAEDVADPAAATRPPAPRAATPAATAPVAAAASAVPAVHGGRDLATGTVLGRFSIDGVLGKSDRCTVYRARQAELGREVALKVLHADAGDPGRARETFLADVRTAASIADPFFVPVLDIGEHDGHAFAALELVAGSSLAERIAKGRRMKWMDLVPVLVDLAQALARLHERGLVHGAVKPTNVFVLDAGGGRLADPRSAPRLRPGEPAVFAAPEQRSFAVADHRSDLYSLGCIAYTALTGETAAPPTTRRANSLRGADASIPDELDELVCARLLAAESSARPADATSVREELLALIDGDGGDDDDAAPADAGKTMAAARYDTIPTPRRAGGPRRRKGPPLIVALFGWFLAFVMTVAATIAVLLFVKDKYGWDVYSLTEWLRSVQQK